MPLLPGKTQIMGSAAGRYPKVKRDPIRQIAMRTSQTNVRSGGTPLKILRVISRERFTRVPPMRSITGYCNCFQKQPTFKALRTGGFSSRQNEAAKPPRDRTGSAGEESFAKTQYSREVYEDITSNLILAVQQCFPLQTHTALIVTQPETPRWCCGQKAWKHFQDFYFTQPIQAEIYGGARQQILTPHFTSHT